MYKEITSAILLRRFEGEPYGLPFPYRLCDVIFCTLSLQVQVQVGVVAQIALIGQPHVVMPRVKAVPALTKFRQNQGRGRSLSAQGLHNSHLSSRKFSCKRNLYFQKKFSQYHITLYAIMLQNMLSFAYNMTLVDLEYFPK